MAASSRQKMTGACIFKDEYKEEETKERRAREARRGTFRRAARFHSLQPEGLSEGGSPSPAETRAQRERLLDGRRTTEEESAVRGMITTQQLNEQLVLLPTSANLGLRSRTL